MNPIHSIVLIASLALLAACSKDEPAPPADTAATGATETAPAPVAPAVVPESGQQPVEVQADAIAIGNAVGDNGAVSAAKTSYSIGDTVHTSMPTRGYKAGSNATVYWTYQDGTSHKEETLPIRAGAEFVHFAFSQADGMKPGKYNVQIDVDFKPVGIVDFKVD